eukprot:6214337-Amphidinium_carterae.1
MAAVEEKVGISMLACRRRSIQLHYILLTTRQPSIIVVGTGRQEGLAAWQRLVQQYKPRHPTRCGSASGHFGLDVFDRLSGWKSQAGVKHQGRSQIGHMQADCPEEERIEALCTAFNPKQPMLSGKEVA